MISVSLNLWRTDDDAIDYAEKPIASAINDRIFSH